LFLKFFTGARLTGAFFAIGGALTSAFFSSTLAANA